MKPLIASCVWLWVSVSAVAFEAYYTRLDRPEGYVGKYSDLVVVLGQANRLEFARANGYLPQWRTAGGTHRVADLFPGSDADPNCYYSYVRLVENGPDRIVVHWRHFKDLAAVDRANRDLDSLDPHGITGAIHELFTIYADGRVEREVRDAANTRHQDWGDPRLASRQSLRLTRQGIEHGPVKPGARPPLLPRAAVEGHVVKESKGLPAPLHHWNLDDGMKPHGDRVKEFISGAECDITGLMTQFKKGVSGTALALDGYYTGVSMESNAASHETLTVAAWVALDAYPYNTAPLVHHSTGFGAEGWYLGLDAYGHPLVRVAGHTVKAADTVLPLYQWTHVCATIGNGKIRLFVDGRERASDDFSDVVKSPATPLLLGRNNERERCTDPVRGPRNNLAFLYGIQGLLDEVVVYREALSADQVQRAYDAFRPADCRSDLAKGVLPGELGAAKRFGAAYKTLTFSDVWDPLWRDMPASEIVVKFDKNPGSVVFWRGTNFAPNWVTDNNRWMADQSTEIGGPHGCSEHMADKQLRHSHVRIIENTPARAVIHWRYPCVDVSYQNLNPRAWSDEYYTIYPDGTGVRQVVWNGSGGSGPGFQDIQFLTNPGESALDVMNLQAMTLANLKGQTRELTWTAPRGVPANTLPDACIEVMNSKSKYKVFAMFQGGVITPWGANEQSKYAADPFAGPWNHWPMHLVPSDGRFVVATDRVSHFALGANDASSKYGSMVLYGFTKEPISRLLPLARSWIRPPGITALAGCTAAGYHKETRDYCLVAGKETMSVRVDASEENPLANPCFTVRNWGHRGAARVDFERATAKDVRQGTFVDTDGTTTLVLWAELDAASPVVVTIRGARPSVASPKAQEPTSLDAQAIKQLASKTEWKEYQGNPVLAPGPAGSWDAGALGSMTVLKVGETFHMYYEAWGVRGNSRADYSTLQIGHATSKDGLNWTKDRASPVLKKGAKGEWDHDGTWDPFVLYENGVFKMWYGGGMESHCDWGYATSADGVNFVKKGRLSHLGNLEDCHVVHDTAKGVYRMYYWDRAHAPNGLFCATSKDETHFDFARAARVMIDGEKYPGAYKFSHVFVDGGVWCMYYSDFASNSTIRFATSADGLRWTSRNKNLLKGHDGEVLKLTDRLYALFYGPQGYFDRRACDIRAAVYAGELIDLKAP